MKKFSLVTVLFQLFFFMQTGHSTSVGDGFSVDIAGGMSVISSKLDGRGFAGELPSSKGSVFDAAISRSWAKSGVKLSLDYSQAEANMDGPVNVNPRSIDVRRSEYSAKVTFSPAPDSGWSMYRYGFSYSIVEYAVTDNTPALIADQTTDGFSAIVGRDFQISEKWVGATDFTLYAPHIFNEGSVHTGFNRKFLGLELALQISYKLREDFSLYLGGRYRQERAGFSGTGDRGTTDARDTRTVISIPFGLRYDFY